MAFWIGLVVVLAVMFGLAAVAQRRRRGNRPGQHGALDGGMAGREATGATDTGNVGGGSSSASGW